MISVIWPDPGVVDATDRGLAYGDGLFETIRVDQAEPFLLERHLQRLIKDASRLVIQVSPEEVRDLVLEAIQRLAPAEQTWVLKIILTRGSGGRGYRAPAPTLPRMLLSAHGMPPAPDPRGVIAASSEFPLMVHPRLAGIKSLNRLQQVMASKDLTDNEYERIMPDPEGCLIEGTRTNLFVALGDIWVTPPMDSLAVAGVMRAEVLAGLQAQGETVELRPVTRQDLASPDLRGVWLTNSVSGIVPVRELDGRHLPLDQRLATILPHGFLWNHDLD